MKTLIIDRKDERFSKKRELSDIPGGLNVEFLYLTAEAQQNLEQGLNNIPLNDYDRVVLKLKFHHIKNAGEFLNSVDNLIIIEHDAFGNFMLNPRFMEF